MKKNRMMRLASTLLILTLLTTSAVSGTFAKYTTSDSATDIARVAKWGVDVAVTGETAFAMKYNNAADESGTQVVSTVDVLAPGTNGTLGTVKINGKPEVMVDVTADVDLEINDQWTYNSENYFPVVIKVNGVAVTYSISDTAASIESEIEAAVIKAILGNDVTPAVKSNGQGATKRFSANSDFGTDDVDVTVTWWWPFEESETGALSGQDDAKDTNLGDKTADTDPANDPTITFTCTVTVIQVD